MMSTKQKVFNRIEAYKGKRFSTARVRKVFPTISSGTLNNILWEFCKNGLITRERAGVYSVNREKLVVYGASHKWYKGGKRKTVKAIARKQRIEPRDVSRTTPASEDVDVLNRLLDTMADAEKVIIKYRKVIAALNNLG